MKYKQVINFVIEDEFAKYCKAINIILLKPASANSKGVTGHVSKTTPPNIKHFTTVRRLEDGNYWVRLTKPDYDNVDITNGIFKILI